MSYLDPSAAGAGSLEKPYIFVSYARKDRDLVYPEVERLERAGYRLWCDRRDIRTGRKWREEIENAIHNCDCFLIFMSEGAATSKPVREEIDQALECRKVIIAVYLEKLPEELDSRIGHIQGLELYLLRKSEYEENLYVALFECVGAPHPSLEPWATIDDPEPDFILEARPNWILPKVVFFGLLVSSAFFGLLAVVAFVTPFFLIVDPRDPLSDRLGGLLVGFLFSIIAAGLAAAAFAVYWLYLRRNHG